MEAAISHGSNFIVILEYHTEPEFSQDEIDRYKKIKSVNKKKTMGGAFARNMLRIDRIFIANKKKESSSDLFQFPYSLILAINDKVEEIKNSIPPLNHKITLSNYVDDEISIIPNKKENDNI